MKKSNAQRQRAYRDRHLKLTDELDDMLERINQMVSLPAKTALKRLASYYGVTQNNATSITPFVPCWLFSRSGLHVGQFWVKIVGLNGSLLDAI